MPDALRHYDFRSWDGGSTSTTAQVTIGDGVQVLVANYQAFYKLTVSSHPANHVSSPSTRFRLTDSMPTERRFRSRPRLTTDITFKQWSGDLSGTSLDGIHW